MRAEDERKYRLWVDIVLFVFAFIVFCTLMGLGTWQVQRLAWKLDLIENVERRAFNAPVHPPNGPVNADDHAYLRVKTAGNFQHDLSQRVKAVTDLGPGHWVLTPLKTPGRTIWINRGFVPSGLKSGEWTAPEGAITLEGLLRITEPGGTLLEKNKVEEGRWVSRDVEALSKKSNLINAAPFFIDADHQGNSADWPRGGLTIVQFRNPHLVYALTWYAMAALLAAGMAYVIYDRWKGGEEENMR